LRGAKSERQRRPGSDGPQSGYPLGHPVTSRKKIISVVGARPNFIKLAPLHDALKKYSRLFSHKIVHTGQHYDYNLSRIFFKDLKLPKPDIYLGVGALPPVEQTVSIMQRFEKVLEKEKPDLVIVYGDVNSTLACSLACSAFNGVKKDPLPLAHVEAGLRSFDLSMPEELNRLVSDHLSKYLFVTESFGVQNLRKEKVLKKNIFLVGDVMIDTLLKYRNKFEKSKILKKLKISPGNYGLVTLHRPVNVDNKNNLKKIVRLFERISKLKTDLRGAKATKQPRELKIIFPVHPRTKKMFRKFNLTNRLKKIKNLKLCEPFNYTDFIRLLSNCKLVLTDSGGIQSEATFLKIPCLTLRDSLEKPEAIKLGTVTLCSLNINFIMRKIREILNGKYKKGKIPKLMDGKASERIARILYTKI
jgi:UDP-N-acetylglucosamine 2-epimerase (non-hydrolysing)